LTNPTEKVFEDSLRYPRPLTDQGILKALKGLLSGRAQGKAKFPAAIVAGKRLIVVYDHPERLKEVILIKGPNDRIRRRRLALKSKKNSSET
jgi:hypothetical protein